MKLRKVQKVVFQVNPNELRHLLAKNKALSYRYYDPNGC